MCALHGAINQEQAIEFSRLLLRIDQMTARPAEALAAGVTDTLDLVRDKVTRTQT